MTLLAVRERSGKLAGKGRMKEREGEGGGSILVFNFIKKFGKILLENPNFRQKWPNDKKVTNLSPESQEILKCAMKGNYAKRQRLYSQKNYITITRKKKKKKSYQLFSKMIQLQGKAKLPSIKNNLKCVMKCKFAKNERLLYDNFP